MTAPLAEALKLAEHGLRVLPIPAGQKAPDLKGWPERATCDPASIERLFAEHSGTNLGVATGGLSGVFVLDVDKKAADGWASLLELQIVNDDLPPTWRDETPSGGAHFWFRAPQGLTIRNPVGFRPGLDIRGERGLVVVPPSVLSAGSYRWKVAPWDRPLSEAPGWLLDLVTGPRLTQPTGAREGRPAGFTDDHAPDPGPELVFHAERVEAAAIGARNDTLFKAAAALGELVGAGRLRRGYADCALEVSAELCGLIRDDGIDAVRATIDSGLKSGMAKPRRSAP